MDLAVINKNFVEAAPFYRSVNPNIPNLFRISFHRKVVKALFTMWRHRDVPARYRDGESAGSIVGDYLGSRIIKQFTGPVKGTVAQTHVHVARHPHDWRRKNGMGGRSWLYRPGRYKMVIVYHDANRAGPHIDVHIDRVSLVYRVKPELYSQIRYNREGYLTEESKKLIIEHVRNEVQNGSRVAQNLDHSKGNARSEWVNGDRTATTYGSGYTRQIVSETEVDIFKAHWNGPIEIYAPHISPHRAVYLYRIYPGQGKRAPILIWGQMSAGPPKLEDRLHLKMIDPRDMDKLLARADMDTSTLKYDSASCYFVIDKKGTTVWSPRRSVKTNEQIEYTHKVNGISSLTSDTTIVGMGELLFVRDGQYVSAAEAGGILNSQRVLPDDLKPEIRIYRIDRVGQTKTVDLEFWQNRHIQKQVAKLHPQLEVVELGNLNEAIEKGFEGIVVAPQEGSINDAFKIKLWADEEDWIIKSVEFVPGEKGSVAGVVRAEFNNKEFKLGPSQVGNQELTRQMMNNPEDYVGRTIKVESRKGHSGRAAKVKELHLDK